MCEEAAGMLFHFAEGGDEVTPRDPSMREKATSSSYGEAGFGFVGIVGRSG